MVKKKVVKKKKAIKGKRKAIKKSKKKLVKKKSSKKVAKKGKGKVRKVVKVKKKVIKGKKAVRGKKNVRKVIGKKVVKSDKGRPSDSPGEVSRRGKMERIPVGVPGFDSLISGGVEKNSTNLLVGGSGSGKTIFATQFMVDGMKKGEKCLYVTFEEKKEQFYANMLVFGWDLADYEKRGLFHFLEYSPIKVQTMLEEGGGAIESIILRHEITRMVVDSITSFALLFDDALAKREAALSLFGMIRNWNATALLTLEEEPTTAASVSSETLEFESDAIIILYFVRKGKKRERYVEVVKMRGTDHDKGIHPFEMGKGGVSVKKSSISGDLGR